MEDYLDAYRNYASNSGIPRIYNEWAAVISVAAVLGQKIHIPRSHYFIFPNLYAMLIGEPGTGKGTCINSILKGILDHAGYTKYAPNKTTKEKFLMDLEAGFEFSYSSFEAADGSSHGKPIGPRELDDFFRKEELEARSRGSLSSGGIAEPGENSHDVLILAEEFNNFLGLENLDFVSLLTELWSYSGTYRQRIKTGKSVSITNPCINLFGGNTHSNLTMAFPAKLLGQGFLARFIFIHGKLNPHHRERAFPEAPNRDFAGTLGEHLKDVGDSIIGPIGIHDDEANEAVQDILDCFTGPKDERFTNYRTRRFVQFLKVCLNIAASKKERWITRDTALTANTLLYATELDMPRAFGEFGRSRNSDVTNKIMEFLYRAEVPVTPRELWKIVSNDLQKNLELVEIMNGLISAEKVLWIKLPENKSGYLPNRAAMIKEETEEEKKKRMTLLDMNYFNWLREESSYG